MQRSSFEDFNNDIEEAASGPPTADPSPGSNQSLVEKVKVLVEDAYMQDIRDTLGGRYHWRKVGNVTEACAHACAGLGTMLAFAAGIYDITALSFSAGCASTMALVLGLWVSYANKESRERSRELNAVLKVLHLNPVPDLAAIGQGFQTNGPANAPSVTTLFRQ